MATDTVTCKVTISRADITGQVAGVLISALNAELTERYPEDGTANHFRLDPEEVEESHGAFLVATLNEKPVACGAVRRIDEQTAEVKRMYVAPDTRGQGIGRQILSTLEDEARRLNVRRLVLETGVRQPEALALYERFGFVRISAFGEYIDSDSPLSVYMEKQL